eukprot:scaffold117041_cov49-Phaeocystis_antarctica.AAC.2
MACSSSSRGRAVRCGVAPARRVQAGVRAGRVLEGSQCYLGGQPYPGTGRWTVSASSCNPNPSPNPNPNPSPLTLTLTLTRRARAHRPHRAAGDAQLNVRHTRLEPQTSRRLDSSLTPQRSRQACWAAHSSRVLLLSLSLALGRRLATPSSPEAERRASVPRPTSPTSH